jgi:hypothetical protein
MVITAILSMCAITPLSATEQPPVGPLVEFVQPPPHHNGLATVVAGPSIMEQPFAARVTEQGIDLSTGVEMPKPTGTSDADWVKMQAEEKAERAKLIPVGAYTLAGQAGQYVGWFGIVRTITSDAVTKRTTLLIQHLYYDGLSDADLQVVSYYGAGDFTVSISGSVPPIPKLALVRSFGHVAKDATGGAVIAPEFMRVWTWGQFTFMDYGLDKTNPAWVRLRKVKGEDAYSSRPDREFYVQRLGPAD